MRLTASSLTSCAAVPKSEDILIPAVFIGRWLMESESVEDFRSRYEHYIKTNKSNWNIPPSS